MQGIEASDAVSKKMSEISNSGTYKNLMHEDLVEEAFVRVMEDLLSDKISSVEVAKEIVNALGV